MAVRRKKNTTNRPKKITNNLTMCQWNGVIVYFSFLAVASLILNMHIPLREGYGNAFFLEFAID